jgi:hypothetical protein
MRSVEVVGKDLGIPPGTIVPVSVKDASLPAEVLWDSILSNIGEEE